MHDNDRRVRGPNFSPEEELELIQNVFIYRHIIENRELDAMTRCKKEAAWGKVLSAFNSKFPPRKLERLRSKYDNLKTMAKKYRMLKQRRTLSDGTIIRPNPLLDLVLEIMEIKATNVSDIENKLDDVSVFPVAVKQEPEEFDEAESTILMDPLEHMENEQNGMIIEAVGQNSSCSLTKIDKTPLDSPPKNLKRSFGVMVKSDAENYYQIEAEYIRKKIQVLEKEQEERAIRLKMEQQQHEMKMKILKLELCIKEQELLKLKKSL